MPDGVCERDTAIRLEEEDPDEVEHAADLEVMHRREVMLKIDKNT